MTTKDNLKIVVTAGTLLWLGLMLAPVLMAAEAWHEQKHPTLDFLFTDATGPTMVYHEVYLEPVSVWYPDANRQGLEQAEVLQRQASEYFQKAFTARGLTVLEQPTERSLIVRVELINLRSTPVTADLLAWARGLRFRVQPGRMTLVADFRDAATGRVLVRMADLEEQAGNPKALLSNVDGVLEQWGEVVAASIATPAEKIQLASIQR